MADAPAPIHFPPMPPTTVLLIEDEPYLREAISRMLAAADYVVLVATRGSEALALAAARPDVSLVLTDVRLPDMTGKDVVAAILAARGAATPPPRVLFMSGHPADLSLRAPLAAHERFLQKPFEFTDMLRLLEELQRLPPGTAG